MKVSKLLFSTILIATLAATPLYAKSTGMTSAEVGTLATVAAIDKNEILIGAIASSKKVDPEVTDFADMMIKQHGSNLNQILVMMNAHPLTGGKADKISADGKIALMKLGAMQDNAFSVAYADAMVNGHEAVLKLIDEQLMKTATSSDVKKFLTDTRAAVVVHLEHAKKMQERVK